MKISVRNNSRKTLLTSVSAIGSYPSMVPCASILGVLRVTLVDKYWVKGGEDTVSTAMVNNGHLGSYWE